MWSNQTFPAVIFSWFFWWHFLCKPPPTPSFHCHSALQWQIQLYFFFFLQIYLFSHINTVYKAVFSQISHNKCQRVLEGTAEERPLRHYQKKSIKCGVWEKPEHKAAALLTPPPWWLRTCGILILHWGDGGVDQSGDEEADSQAPGLLLMKRRSMQLGDNTSKSFLPARSCASSKIDSY